jgi:replicative DNA helicase
VVHDDRLPPHNIEAEEAVIGSLLIDPEAIRSIDIFLKAEDFFREQNQWLYEACCSLDTRGEAIDEITVAQEMARRGKLENVGGASYLSHLVAIIPTSVHVEHYARIVHRLAIIRRLIGAAGRIAAIGYEADPDVDAVLDKAEDIIFKIRRGESPRDFVHIRQALELYFEDSEPHTSVSEGRLPHILTGFSVLDSILGGMQRSDVIILAARPSLGKSSLALNIARNAALEQNAHVALFSLEMSKDQLVQRLLSSEAEVDSKKMRLGAINPNEERLIMNAAGILSEAPIYIDDTPALRIMEMRSKARRLHYEQGIDLLIIDYLQLMQIDGKMESKVQEVSEISRSIKALARELDIPIIAVSQLSRAAEQRQSHIPMLSDLRDSGSLEQDADIVMFIYREDFYTKEEDWYRHNPDKPYPKGIAEIMVSKHRHGPIGQLNLRFMQKTARFTDLEMEGGEIEQQSLPRFSG